MVIETLTTKESRLTVIFTEEFMCQGCDLPVKDEGELCAICQLEEIEADNDRRFDERAALGTI